MNQKIKKTPEEKFIRFCHTEAQKRKLKMCVVLVDGKGTVIGGDKELTDYVTATLEKGREKNEPS